MKKIYTNNSFLGHWPVGTSAVVIAENATEAAYLLNEELKKHNLKSNVPENHMEEFPSNDDEKVRILQDGNY